MPLVPINQPELGYGDLAPLRRAVPLDENSDPGFWETMGAAFRQENLIVSALSSDSLLVDDDAVDPDLNVWQEIAGTPYEPHWERFADVTNRGHLMAVQTDIDQEIDDRRTLAAAGLGGFAASLLAGVADVTSLIPGGALVRGARVGYSATRSGLAVGAAAGVGTSIQELGLHGTQQTRTLQESAVGVGSSVVLGALLGSGMARLMTRAEINGAIRALDEQRARDAAPAGPTVADDLEAFAAAGPDGSGISRPDPADIERMAAGATGGRGGVGAELVERDTLDDLSVAGPRVHAIGRLVGRNEKYSWLWLNPALRLIYSPSAMVRSVAERMLEYPVYFKKNLEGEASALAVETLMKQSVDGLAVAIDQHNRLFREMREAGVTMDRQTFRRLVGRAMRREDKLEDEDGNLLPVGIPYDDQAAGFASQAAQMWRGQVFDPLKERAIELGLLPENVTVKEADSYFTRVYLTPKITAREGAWRATIRGYLEGAVRKWAETLVGKADRRIRNLNAQIDELEMSKLRRAEELRRREQRDPDAPDEEISDSEAMGLIQLLRQGRPKTPETLMQFLRKQGGLVDHAGELKHMGITSRSAPGFVRRQARSVFSTERKEGGLPLDRAGEAAFEAGFFPERPTVAEFLDALSDDFNKHRVVVRQGDEHLVQAAEAYDELEAQISRLGLDADSRRLPVGRRAVELIRKANVLLDQAADKDITKLRNKIGDVGADVQIPRGLLEDLERAAAKAAAAADETDPATKAALEKASRDAFAAFGAYIDDVVDSTTGKILGRTARPAGTPDDVRANLRGPLAAREFHIQDREIEDWLEDDIEIVARRYVRTMAADVELAEKFGRPDMMGILDDINESYRTLVRDAESRLSGDELETALGRLERDRKSDVEDIEAVRDLLRGQYRAVDQVGNWARILRLAQVWNFVTKLGGVLVSSLTDTTRPGMVHGFSQVFRDGLPALKASLKALRDEAPPAIREARLAGTVAEKILHSRLATMAEVHDPYSFSSPLERFMDNVSTFFGYASGLTPYTDMMKGFSAVLTQNRILDDVVRYAELDDRERAYLAFLGIDQGMAERIARQFAGGETHTTAPTQLPAELMRGGGEAAPRTGSFPVARLDAQQLLTARETAAEARAEPYGEFGEKLTESDLQGVQVRSVVGEPRLESLLTRGIDPGAHFRPERTVPYLVVSTNNFAGGAVQGVVVNGAAAVNLAELRSAFPGVAMMSVDEFKAIVATGRRAASSAPEAAPAALAAPAPNTFGATRRVTLPGFGETTADGVKVANTERWTDAQAVRAFRAAVAKDVDSTIVTAGIGDLPLWARTPLGRAVIQFKSFGLASHQRVLMRGLQEGRARFLPGMMSMVMWGMFIYYLKTIERGAELSDNPGTWVAEGLDRSGIFSLAFEVSNTAEKFGIPGLYTAARLPFSGTLVPEGASRFRSRSNVSALLGPTFGLAKDAADLGGLPIRAFETNKRTGQFKGLESGDLRAIRGNIPGASLPYWRWLLDRELFPLAKEAVKG